MLNKTFIQSPNYTVGHKRRIDFIVLHWWGSPASKPTLSGVVAHFQRKVSQVSAHYVISDKKCVQMVDEAHIAWHAGNKGNPNGIGIEVDPNTPGGTYETVAQLIADIWRRHGIKPIVPHNKFMPTQCPGSIDLKRIESRAKQLYGIKNHPAGKAKATPVKAPAKAAVKKSITAVAREVIAGKWGNGQDRFNRLRAAGYSAQEVQTEVNRVLQGGSKPPAVLKSVNQIAREVIAGKWGNGNDRISRLRAAGYHPATVQNEVNRILLGR